VAVDLAAPDRRRQVRDWLARLGHGTPAIPGVAGPIAFDARHGVAGREITLATVDAGSAAGAP
jgi:hypothetical protein